MPKERQLAIARAVGMAVILLNQILVMVGYSPIPYGSEQVEHFVTGAFTVITTFYVYWKNNNITRAAIRAQRVLDEQKGK